jgi:DNA-binding NarL/FixJ family response regulator
MGDNVGLVMTASEGFPEHEKLVSVVVVDDHDLFRFGLVALLNGKDSIDVVGQASRASLGVQLVLDLRPDVVLMDLGLPDIDGIAATRQILEREPDTRVIVLTVASEDGAVESAVLAGACGYILKDSPVEEIVSAVHAATAGEAWLSPRAANAVLEKLRRDHIAAGSSLDPSPTILSPRELEILRLVARGLENAEIAAELSISPRTAKNHLSNVLAKLGMTNRVQAAIYAVRHGIG